LSESKKELITLEGIVYLIATMVSSVLVQEIVKELNAQLKAQAEVKADPIVKTPVHKEK